MADDELQTSLSNAKIKIIQRVTEKSRGIVLDAPPLEIANHHDYTSLEAVMVRAKHRTSLLKRLGNVTIFSKLFR